MFFKQCWTDTMQRNPKMFCLLQSGKMWGRWLMRCVSCHQRVRYA